jgi:arabinan endo-1,5-alpha-L-arabinosidase
MINRRPAQERTLALLASVAFLVTCWSLMGCSGRGAGGTAGTGGLSGTGGAATSGGATAAGGALSSGGSGGTGLVVGSGGASSSGGTTAAGGAVEAGPGGGTASDAGRAGGSGSGGAIPTGGTRATGGAIATGGAAGRTTAAGGATGTGGIVDADGGTAIGSDRCDVGVYNSASPPKVLSLSGALGCHDPSAIAVDSTYYAFCTGLSAETSTNLTTWKSAGRPFAAPAWLSSAIPGVGDLWAPDISQFGGKFHLYYAGSTFGANKSCIGHATRDSLATGSWSDDGAATICSNVGSSDNWNAIDPNLVTDTDGNLWLTLGSFWSGLKIIQLDSAGKRVGTTVTAIANRPNSGGALEAPFMVRRCGYYYLFMSWDKCCNGASSTYNIRVVRGTSVTGPFVDKAGTAALQGGGTLIAEGDASFAGPGGQSVMFVGNQAYLVYHAYAKPSGAITLRIAELVWDADGWPVPVGP